MGKKELDRFSDLLKKKGLKLTRERRELVEQVLEMKKHFDSDTLYETIKKKGSRIARDTVYRTMPLFLECGVLQKSVGDGRKEYFERTDLRGHHDHMVCINCGTVIEFHSEALEELQERLADEYRFDLIFHDHRLFGRCSTCQGKAKN